MRVTSKIRYDWRDFTEVYFVKCASCGKSLQRSVSEGCNELAEQGYVARLRERLRARAAELSQESVTCNSCLVGRIQTLEGFAPLEPKLLDAADVLRHRKLDVQRQCREMELLLNERYGDRILSRRGEEWVAEYFNVSPDWGDPKLLLYAARVNKRQPWRKTDVRQWLDVRECAFSEQTLMQRWQAVGHEG